MKHYGKILLAFMMSAAMLLPACSGANNAPAQSAEPAAAPASEAPAPAEETPAEPAEQTAAASEAPAETTETEPAAEASGEAVEMELFVNHTWWPIKEWSGSVPEMITEKTGVRPVITVAADMQQLPLMIASDDLPELIYTDNTQNMQNRLADAQFSWSYDDLLTQYAPDFKWDEDRAKLYRKADGKFYTLLNSYSTKAELDANPYVLEKMGAPIVQQHLLDELGNPEIKTLEDYVNVLTMAKEQFPDLVPVIFNTNWTGAGQTSAYLFSQFGVDYNGFTIDENTEEISYYIYQSGRLDYYKFMNRLYREGLMLPENYAFSNEDESIQYATGLKCFSYIKNTDNALEINNMCRELGIESDWVEIEPNLGGESFKRYNRNIGWSGLYVSLANKNPQKAADFVSFMQTEEGMKLGLWGIEGEHWNYNDKNFPEFIPEIADSAYADAEGINWWGILTGTYAIESLGGYRMGAPDEADLQRRMEISTFIKDHTVYVSALGLVNPQADSDEQNILTKLNDMVKNEEVKIYLAESEEECEQAYNDMLAMAESLQVQTLEDWANQEYKNMKAIMGE